MKIFKKMKIYVAGHNGMVGSSVVRKLKEKGYDNLILKSHAQLELLDQKKVFDFLKLEKPDYIFMAAAKVGGINANNTLPADFIYSNSQIQNNIIHGAYMNQIKNIIFLGSSCIYPRNCKQPMKEEYLLSGSLEKTNEPYAVAKILGLKMCESYNRQYNTNYISVMPTNLYGPGDTYDSELSHVIPSLILKTHKAKTENKDLVLWGSGTPKREFLFVDDFAEACIFLMEKKYNGTFLNIGTGEDLSIKELANKISKIVDFKGKIIFDKSKPDGTPQKLLDVGRINSLGWKFKCNLDGGLKVCYKDYLDRFFKK